MKTYENLTEKIPILLSKRLFDIIFSLILILLFSPLFVVILLGILIEHILTLNFRAYLFFTEIRISRGEPFKLIKFNIFNPRILKEKRKRGDKIYTKKLEKEQGSLGFVGSLVQKIYLDELPQLFNVLAGDMSMVGPRPVNLQVYERDLERGIKTRSFINTGLTGYSQAQKGFNKKDQVALDIDYINFCLNNPVWKIIFNDFFIIIKTLKVIFRAEGI